MKSRRILLFSSSNIYEREFRNKSIYKGVFLIGLGYIIFSFLIADYRVELSKNALQQEIQECQKKKTALHYEYDLALSHYEITMACDVQKEFFRTSVSLVNSYLHQECIKWWGDIIYAGQFLLMDNFNDWTLKKLKSSPTLYKMTPAAGLILAVAALENGFDILGRSPKGAVGAFQLHPALTSNMRTQNPEHPEQNIRIGINYLNSLLVRFAEYRDQIEFTLASFNAGPTRVKEKWMAEWGPSWQSINKGLQQNKKSFKETRNYVSMGKYLMRLYTSGEWIDRPPKFWKNYRTLILKDADATSLAAIETFFLQ